MNSSSLTPRGVCITDDDAVRGVPDASSLPPDVVTSLPARGASSAPEVISSPATLRANLDCKMENRHQWLQRICKTCRTGTTTDGVRENRNDNVKEKSNPQSSNLRRDTTWCFGFQNINEHAKRVEDISRALDFDSRNTDNMNLLDQPVKGKIFSDTDKRSSRQKSACKAGLLTKTPGSISHYFH